MVRDAGTLSGAEMQLIAREMNYSETTFILSDQKNNDGYDVRIFTPAEEVPFAGHPTLGTAYVIQNEIIKNPVGALNLNLKIGPVPVSFDPGNMSLLWMKQQNPEFGGSLDPAEVSSVLSIGKTDIDDNFPIREVSTGLPFIIVPLRDRNSLKKIRIDREKYYRLIENAQAKALLAFCPAAQGNDLEVRVFADYYGIPEDPATGSGNGCLAGYLVKYRYFGSDQIDLRVGQGREVGRPSLIYLKAAEDQAGIDICVGGNVVLVAKGEFF